MTIKNRLAISNFLMIIIPVFLALFIGFIAIATIWLPLVHQNNVGVRDLEDFEKASTFIVQQIEEDLLTTQKKEENGISAIAEYLRNITGYTVQIIAADGTIKTFGDEPGAEVSVLRAAADQLNEPGIVSTGTNAVNKKQIETPHGAYEIYVYGTQLKTRTWPGKSAAKIVGWMIFICVAGTIFLTNRFLTRFVFRHIQGALEELSKGVHQIRDGNLHIRIQHKVTDEFTPICEDFNDMAVRLRESVEVIQNQEKNRKELVAGMSHDLRSPLTSIKAYTEGLIDGVAQTPEAQTRYLEMIRTKANDIERMIANLFMFSKMDFEEYPCYPEVIELNKEIAVIIQQDMEEYKAKGLQIDGSNIKPCGKIYADPAQLRSMISNILENSLKYKEQPTGSVRLRCDKHGDRIQFIIEDDGPGVPQEDLSRLFDVFYRSDPSRSNPHKGSGLGLAIVEKAVLRMGGSIRAENVLPHGLKIVISFPKHREESM